MVGSASDPCRVCRISGSRAIISPSIANRDFGSGSHRYREWAEPGTCKISPGKSIDPEAIALFIAELTQRYHVKGLAYDRWRINDLLREFDRIGLQAYQDGEKGGDGLRLVPWGQGFRTWARPSTRWSWR